MATISAATESGLTFATLLLQQGQNYYNDAQTETTFNTNEAIDAFEMWTDFYTKYDFDQTYDAFSRFRTGEYPIVMSDYCTFFNQLAVAAPEISGLWDFAPIPGTVQEDGSVSHAVNSNNTGAVIFNKVAKCRRRVDIPQVVLVRPRCRWNTAPRSKDSWDRWGAMRRRIPRR